MSIQQSAFSDQQEESVMKDFKELKVWQKSHRLTLEVYGVTAGFPHQEMYGLTSQLRRSCSSVPSNIAEGCGRGGDAELARFLQIAMGSASETEYLILLARDLNYLDAVELGHLLEGIVEVKMMLTGFIQKLRSNLQ